MDEQDKSVWIGAATLAVVIAGGVLLYRFAATPPPAAPISQAAPAAAPAVAAPSVPLPKLEESDDFVRAHAGALSSDPHFAAWLKNDNLISRFVAAINMIALGKVPQDALKFLAPTSPFRVVKRGGKIYMDPRNYKRYDAVAGVIGAVDAKVAAYLFRVFKPLIQQASDSLGETNGDVQDVFVRAATKLVNTPVMNGDVELLQCHKGIVYVQRALTMEVELTPAQKQLIRMGPTNEGVIQRKLIGIVTELGAKVPPAGGGYDGLKPSLESVCHE